MVAEVLHPQSSKGKFTVKYKKEYIGMDYLKDDKGVVYFDDKDVAIKEAMGRPCWSVARITNPLGK